MNPKLVDKIAAAILYEGYILYPYRASSRKNRERFTFGRVYPHRYSLDQNGAEPWVMQTECLARRLDADAAVTVEVRFLQAILREIGAGPGSEPFHAVPGLCIDGQHYQTWQEAAERSVAVPALSLGGAGERTFGFSFGSAETTEPIRDSEGTVAGSMRRRNAAVAGEVGIAIVPLDADAARIRVRVMNRTPISEPQMRDSEALPMRTFASTHAILRVQGAEFLSLTDPPPEFAQAAADCANVGAWPVLVGEEATRERDTMLASPIILYDYPQIAPESAGDLCDGTEIDEILTLRILTMTDAEKAEMRGVDAVARRILERTESLGNHDLWNMHGTMRDVRFSEENDFFDESRRLRETRVRGATLRAGDRVRIRPKHRADAIDMMLAGKVAAIEAIEQDAEGRVHFALVVEDDPGRDLGMLRQPGHRFFYTAEEVEPMPEDESCAS